METDFIYLASASPRRAELLRQLGVEFRVRPAELEEAIRPGESPAHYVERTAREKAAVVSGAIAASEAPTAVLGADTVVVADARVLGKPGGLDAALAMLELLSGRTHDVLSAVAVTDGRRTHARVCSSKVRFRATTARERAAYCATPEPFDKAGAYGIQGFAAAFIEQLEGSYSAVMGLPLFETAELLAPFAQPRWLHAIQDR
ncbi:MAG: Maf family protein [Gammaproteobacteria bacterium]|jgi:septum formation protein